MLISFSSTAYAIFYTDREERWRQRETCTWGGGDVDGVRDEERERGETQRIVDAEWGRERPGC